MSGSNSLHSGADHLSSADDFDKDARHRMNGEPTPQILSASFAGFSACEPGLIVLARLVGAAGQSLTLKALQVDLADLIASAELTATVKALAAKGDVRQDGQIEITRQGVYSVKLALGSDRVENWPRTKATRLPLLTLGLDPSDSETRRKFASAGCLKAAVIAVTYSLPPQSMTSTRAVCSELVWRLVGSLFPKITGNAPYEKLEKFGPIERALLSGLIGTKHETFFEIVNAIASAAVGLENASITEIRQRLIRIGVERAAQA